MAFKVRLEPELDILGEYGAAAVKEGRVKHPNAADRQGTTALHWMAHRGLYGDICALLTVPGIDVSATNLHEQTPLHVATRYGHASCVKLLLEHKAVQSLGYNAWTPLHLVAYHGFAAILPILLEAKGRVDVVNSDGETPLQQAIARSHRLVTALLLEGGATIPQGQQNLPSWVSEAVTKRKNFQRAFLVLYAVLRRRFKVPSRNGVMRVPRDMVQCICKCLRSTRFDDIWKLGE